MPTAAPRPVFEKATVAAAAARHGVSAPSRTPVLASPTPATTRSAPSADVGNARIARSRSRSPKTSAVAILSQPRTQMDAPPRAPNLYCPARPPAPWQAGAPPNQQQNTFITPTDVATDLRVGASSLRLSGNSFSLSAVTEMTELSVVNGSWGSPARSTPRAHSARVGARNATARRPGRQSSNDAPNVPRAPASATANTRPAATSSTATGTRPPRFSAPAAARLSNPPAIGPSTAAQPGPAIIRSARPIMRNPRPSWMPETTLRGTSRFTASMVPVAPRSSTAAPTKMPAADTAPADNPSAIAAAATVFMGCTGMGTSQA